MNLEFLGWFGMGFLRQGSGGCGGVGKVVEVDVGM